MDTAATDLLASDLAWADRIARLVYRRHARLFDIEDLQQVARIAVWKARLNYDPGRNDNFQLYAMLWVRGAVLMLVRATYRKDYRLLNHFRRESASVLMPELSIEPVDLNLEEIEGPEQDLDEMITEQGREQALRWAIRKLDQPERDLIRLMLAGFPVAGCARALEISLSAAYALRDSAFRQLRLMLGRHAQFVGQA